MAPADEMQPDPGELDELIAVAVAERQLAGDGSAPDGAYEVLVRRSGSDLLDRASALTRSSDWMERALGVDLLGQLHDPAVQRVAGDDSGSHRQDYVDASLTVLLPLAKTETDPAVRQSIAAALGHRGDPRGIEPLTAFVASGDVAVRLEATKSLGLCSEYVGDPTPNDLASAIKIVGRIADALLGVVGDPVGEVRDWALFGLLQLDFDTAEIRDAFADHLHDPHDPARQEAIAGLANLGDDRGVEPLLRLMAEGCDATALLEACEKYADERFVPFLMALRDDEYADDEAQVDRALQACLANRGWARIDRRWP